MVTRDIHAFVGRDWQAVRDRKDMYWAARIAALGPGEGLRIADQLWRHARAVNPQWPDAVDRARDLHAHVRLSTLLRRAGSTRGR